MSELVERIENNLVLVDLTLDGRVNIEAKVDCPRVINREWNYHGHLAIKRERM